MFLVDGLGGQALGGSAAYASATGLAAAAATVVINSMGEGSLRNLVRRKWGNMPALAATLLLVWDAAKPLVAILPPPPIALTHTRACILTGVHICGHVHGATGAHLRPQARRVVPSP